LTVDATSSTVKAGEMQESLTRTQDLIEARRQRELELAATGLNYTEIARLLHFDLSTVSRDFSFMREQARMAIDNYLNERLPLEYQKCLISLDAITREAWKVANESDARTKIQALTLAKECALERMDLLTHTTTIDGAIRFVERARKRASEEPDQEAEIIV